MTVLMLSMLSHDFFPFILVFMFSVENKDVCFFFLASCYCCSLEKMNVKVV